MYICLRLSYKKSDYRSGSVWKGRGDKVKRKTLIGDIAKGDLKIPDIG